VRLTVQWEEGLDRALDRMDRAGCDELLVLQGARPIGRIGRERIEAVRASGAWLGAVSVADVMRQDGRRKVVGTA
jgi:hypothetical protein